MNSSLNLVYTNLFAPIQKAYYSLESCKRKESLQSFLRKQGSH